MKSSVQAMASSDQWLGTDTNELVLSGEQL